MSKALTPFFNEITPVCRNHMPEFAKKHPVQSGLSAASLPVSMLMLSQGLSFKLSLLVLAVMNLPTVKAASDDFGRSFDPSEWVYPGISL